MPAYFFTSLRLPSRIPDSLLLLRTAELNLNVTNLANETDWSTFSLQTATNSFSAYPIAPRQWFLTLSAGL